MPEIDPNGELQRELETFLAKLEPRIRGLQDLSVISQIGSISAELKAELDGQVRELQEGQGLARRLADTLGQAKAVKEALVAKGYPELRSKVLDPALQAELDGERADLLAGLATFQEAKVASNVTIQLGTPAAKAPRAP